MRLIDKLSLLADAAKYDASCASSGAPKRDATQGGIGSTEGHGICHAYAPDGRCISLLKVLLTNYCSYDCAYCINRRSSNVPRARFRVDELVNLFLSFYRRNYVEGLFLSSGIIKSSDYTMEQMTLVAKTLRLEHGFKGYIHLKTIPEASPELIAEAGLWADRLSINIELPTEAGLNALAPEKDEATITSSMDDLASHIAQAKENAAPKRRSLPNAKTAPRFAPSGQSTQMIVGADGADDAAILDRSRSLYDAFDMRRVYYSGFSPIPDADRALPLDAVPLVREHRLYQSDWLMRFYGFGVDEIVSGGTNGMLDLDIDPKLAWALKNRGVFPVDLNRADREMLLRVPGLGAKTVDAVISSRRHRSLRMDDLARLTKTWRKAQPFVCAVDHRPAMLDAERLRASVAPKERQLTLL